MSIILYCDYKYICRSVLYRSVLYRYVLANGDAPFRDAFKSRRCLVPADGFYEWKPLGAKTKQPYRFIMRDGSPMAFAGLWERWRDPANGETVKSFTIITGEPNALCAPIHNRMPVILDPADFPAWRGETPAAPEQLQALLDRSRPSAWRRT
jgi:putative SOS response-associated peptidase YedK